MNSQPKWDIYESVVLLNGYLLACKKSEPRAYIIRRVSADLRAMAIHRGRKIDEIFRNENGISYQMQSMDSAYKGRKIYVPATKLFQETVSLYRNQNSRFQELLKEARYMIEHDIAHPALNDTDVFVVDFNDCPDMSFARVNSLTYRGQAILIRPKWRDLYIALLKKLYADYSNEIDSVVGKVYGRASAPFVGNCHSISLMRSPGEFAPDRYVELMRAALKGYLESGVFTVGNYEGTASSGVILCGNISKETMDNDGTTDMFCELPAVFHESALIERFHGFIKGWNIPRMNDDLKISGWALNSEYFCSILHELRDDTTYRSIVDALVVVPAGADTRDTEAVKRIATAYLKLLFPNVKKPEDIDSRDFNRYCLRRACNMRATIKMQLGIMDSEYRGKDIPAFKVAEIN